MFTGIVEARGTVEELEPKGTVTRVVIATDLPVEELPLGASIAVDGVCLTVIERSSGRFAADLGPETLALTTLNALAGWGARAPRAGAEARATRWAATWSAATSTGSAASWRAARLARRSS